MADPTPASRPDPQQLATLLRDGDLDAAIEAGLMDFVDDTAQPVDPPTRALLDDARQRLRAAWDARERYRARNARLQRRKAEREARRSPPPLPSAPPALPSAAAAALARAKARVRT